jgi:branched-chain amino acid transport system permease protein
MTILNILIIGLALGSVYGLLATAMGITWQTSRMLDLAIGAYAAVGGMIAAAVGFPWGAAAGILAAAALGWGMGLIFLTLQKRGSGDTISAAFASVGVLFASTSFVLYWFGANPLRLDFLSGLWRVGDTMISKQGSFNTIVSCCVALVVMCVFRYTAVGHLLTASAISPRNAELTGIPVKKLQWSTFAVSGMVAGIAGVLMVFTRGMSYDLSFGLTIAAFGAMIVLGTSSIITIFLGGIVLGLIEAVAMGYLPAAYASLAPLLFILVTLIAGRFGGERGDRP